MTPTTKVKICGLKTEAALDAALAGGADYVGLVFFPPSPRNIVPAAASALAARARNRAKIVALLVDPDDALIETVIAAADPDLLQLHGEEAPERVAQVRRRWGKPVMKAIKVATAEDAQAAFDYGNAADLILFDARAPQDSTRPGGHGAAFDWTRAGGHQGPARLHALGRADAGQRGGGDQDYRGGHGRCVLRRGVAARREGPRADPALSSGGKGG